jgi:hypothetical protein
MIRFISPKNLGSFLFNILRNKTKGEILFIEFEKAQSSGHIMRPIPQGKKPLPVPDRPFKVEPKLKFLLKCLKSISPPEWADFANNHTPD